MLQSHDFKSSPSLPENCAKRELPATINNDMSPYIKLFLVIFNSLSFKYQLPVLTSHVVEAVGTIPVKNTLLYGTLVLPPITQVNVIVVPAGIGFDELFFTSKVYGVPLIGLPCASGIKLAPFGASPEKSGVFVAEVK